MISLSNFHCTYFWTNIQIFFKPIFGIKMDDSPKKRILLKFYSSFEKEENIWSTSRLWLGQIKKLMQNQYNFWGRCFFWTQLLKVYLFWWKLFFSSEICTVQSSKGLHCALKIWRLLSELEKYLKFWLGFGQIKKSYASQYEEGRSSNYCSFKTILF